MLISIHQKDQHNIAENIQQFKNNGLVNFANILSVPSQDRLPGLVKVYGQIKIQAVLMIMITEFANSFNLIRPMTSDQIAATAFELISTSYEDNLAIEDFAIFFNGAKSAKYGRILDRMDQQTIFELFENYREARHRAYIQQKNEDATRLQSYGSSMRLVDEKHPEKDIMRAEMNRYYADTLQKNGNTK